MNLKKCPCCNKQQTTKNAQSKGRQEMKRGYSLMFNCLSCGSTFIVEELQMAKQKKIKAHKLLIVSALISMSLGLTACGGGGGSSPAAIATPVAQPGAADPGSNLPADPTPTTTTTVPPVYTFGGGQGTIGQPYVLQTPSDIQHIGNFPSAYYTLQNNIDMTGFAFVPIASFSGVLYGNSFSLDHLHIIVAGSGTAAMFLNLSGTLVNFSLTNALSQSGSGYAALFAGVLASGALLSNTQLYGTVTSPLGGNGYNSGTGVPAYVTKQAGTSIGGPSGENIMFNGNHVNTAIQ